MVLFWLCQNIWFRYLKCCIVGIRLSDLQSRAGLFKRFFVFTKIPRIWNMRARMNRAREEWVATTVAAQLRETRNTQVVITLKFEAKLICICRSATTARRWQCRHVQSMLLMVIRRWSIDRKRFGLISLLVVIPLFGECIWWSASRCWGVWMPIYLKHQITNTIC